MPVRLIYHAMGIKQNMNVSDTISGMELCKEMGIKAIARHVSTKSFYQ